MIQFKEKWSNIIPEIISLRHFRKMAGNYVTSLNENIGLNWLM